MKMFIHERGDFGVRLISVQHAQQLGWDCGNSEEIDLLVKAVKAELDRAAANMRAALREQVAAKP